MSDICRKHSLYSILLFAYLWLDLMFLVILGNLLKGKAPEWKKLNSKDLGITSSMISKPTRLVLNGLKSKG